MTQTARLPVTANASSLLPSTVAPSIRFTRARVDERLLAAHDAAIVVTTADDIDTTLALLPSHSMWQRLYRDTRSRGPVQTLCSRAGTAATLVTVAVFRPDASAFERLTLAGRAWKDIASVLPRRILLVMPASSSSHAVEAVLAAVLAGSARMPSFKSRAQRKRTLETISIAGAATDINVERVVATEQGNHLARWLTSLPPNVLNVGSYRRALQSLARREDWAFKFYSEPTLRRLGAGAFLAVTRASSGAGGIARLSYRPRRARGAIALVGKGVCFDTGGINLKTHKGMYQMHEDMQGSAVAVGTLLALSNLGVDFGIDCWLALAENDIGPKAYRPQEVVWAVNGTSIQVVHSDAEGRMVLADTLALAAREEPDAIIDYATLTGSCVTALTERYSGVFTNRPALNTVLQAAGQASGERVWPFPMDEDFDRELESHVADLLQCTPDSKGDHILGARFLNHFVPAEIPWTHVDLAASNSKGGLAHIPTDFTGFGVRWTLELLLGQHLLKHLKSPS
ncbi:MAG: M17 family metallopeptidase [Steroidobacteraceae bacterium]